MKRKQILLAILCLSACLTAMADGPVAAVDSLLSVYEKSNAKQRTILASQVMSRCLDGDEVVTDLPLVTSQTPKDTADLLVWFAADRYYYNTGDFKRALDYADRALSLTRDTQPSALSDNIRATLLSDRGYLLYKLGNMEKATEASQQAVKFAKQAGNHLQLSRAYLYLSIINMGMSQPKQAIDFVEKAIETNDRLGLNNNTHNAYGIACEVYSFARQPEKAIEYGRKAVDAARQVKSDAGVANHLMQLSYAYDISGDYQHGVEAAQQAIDFVESMTPPNRDILAVAIVYKAYNLLDMKSYREAADAMRQAIAIQEDLGNVRAVCNNYKALYEALSHYDEHAALAALRRFAMMNDSLHMADLHAALSNANAEFKNDELQQENTDKSRQNSLILITAIVVVALLLLAIGMLAYAMRLKSHSNHALRSLQRARESFFTNITHEFRTPLTLILGLSQQLKTAESKDIGEIHEAGTVIERNGNRLLNLINQLLDISKVQANVTQPQWRHGNIVPYVQMLMESYQLLANQKGVDLNYAPEQGNIEMDFVPDYMQKIFGNLLSNAIKYTPEYGNIYITTRTVGDQFLLTVADTGRGIGEEQLQHIFEPFYQSSSDDYDIGTGVGLSLVKQIVDAVGGTVKAVSAPGNGSVFTVAMPLQQEGVKVGERSRKPISEEEMQHIVGQLRKDGENDVATSDGDDDAEPSVPRILVVEDNRDVAYYISSQLEDDYEIFYATNGSVGLEKAESLVPDLIITDLMMPEMDGLELCRRVRSSDIINHVPIIVITAKSTEEERIRGIEAGADAYLFKPFNSDELNMRVSKLLEQRYMLRQKFVAQSALRQAASADDDTALNLKTTQADTQFLGRITDLVYSLMKRGNVDVDTIASQLCMSPSQFRRKFTGITGETPGAYIMNIRMSNAQRLIDAHPDWSLGKVAEQCGFSDNAHFTNAFKRIFGITPSQYAHRAK